MRVSHVITRLIVGGAQENTIASVLGLQSKPGLDLELISGPSQGPEGSLESAFRAAPGALKIFPDLLRPIHPWKDLRAYQELKRHFKKSRPDLVHTHSGKAGILGRLAAAHAGVPYIIHTIHGPSFGNFQGALPNLIFRGAERRAARVTTHFVTVANAMRDQYLAAGIGTLDKYTRIFSGFPLAPLLTAENDLALRAKYGLAPDDIVVGKIARLFKLKGHDDLFASAPAMVRENPKLRFLIIGDGEWRTRFEAMAVASGVARHFIFTGLIAPADVPRHIGILDLLVHLSTREGLARALPMALAASKPVIAYDCDGAREVCLDGETGFLVRPGHTQHFQARVILLARDAALRKQLGLAGQTYVKAHFSVETMVDSLHDLYQRLTTENRVAKRRAS